MPFTPAHAAAVIPLRRLGLPMSALVAGSLAPDLPMFLPGRSGYAVTHSVWGVLTTDPLVALAAVWLWFALVRDPYADVVPRARDRVPASVSLTRRQWWLAAPAAAVGALTHVVWDSATHPGRWLAVRVEWLQTEHAGLLGLQWAQYVSGVVGVAVVVGYAVWWLGGLPATQRAASVRRPLWWCLAAPAASLVAGVAAFAAAPGLSAGALEGAVAAIQGLVLAMVAVSVLWHVVVSRARVARA
ncbi:DUF4184 family protein [Xylanimonas sp. McL0601]|uniref:DUF4184 family protein n=1 Tax=Xylanimonas sp. McL0601 TaxID=3414739 RepID=UPI003CF1093C